MPERDHLEYLKSKQDSNKIRTFQSPIRQKKFIHTKNETQSQISGSGIQGQSIGKDKNTFQLDRRSSNVSMKDESQSNFQ